MVFQRKVYHRDEKCLNCGYPIIGNFCGECGQKAHLHKDNLGHMIVHFIGDYFHYDNKFWRTLKILFTKPGLITLEYIQGRRVKYLNPIQLYIFVTTLFFLFLFSTTDSKDEVSEEYDTSMVTVPSVVNLNYKVDSTQEAVLNDVQDSILSELNETMVQGGSAKSKIGIGKWSPSEINLKAYDSVQNNLPDSLKDSYWKRKLKRATYRDGDNFGDLILHNFPKMFFLLLPIFAFILMMLFRKQKYYYVDHIIFSLHFHAVLFFILGIESVITYFISNEVIINAITFCSGVGIIIYLFFSLKRVYPSPLYKIVFKQIALFFLYLIMFLLCFVLLLIALLLFA